MTYKYERPSDNSEDIGIQEFLNVRIFLEIKETEDCSRNQSCSYYDIIQKLKMALFPENFLGHRTL